MRIRVARTATNGYAIQSLVESSEVYWDEFFGATHKDKVVEQIICRSATEAQNVLKEKTESGKCDPNRISTHGCKVRVKKEGGSMSYVIEPEFGSIAERTPIICDTSVILHHPKGAYITRAIRFLMDAHNDKARSPEKCFRKWDNETPYGIHPIWCAMAILHETKLVTELRWRGAIALLLHDILEDTTEGIPNWVPEDIRALISAMTFSSSAEEMREIWQRSTAFVRLLKLYDKVSNLMDGAWMSDEQRKKYAEYTKKLADDAKENFGELNIIKIAYALAE